MRSLTEPEVRSRFDALVRHLDHWGDVVASDEGRRRGRRLLQFQLLAPGGGLDVEVRALFREYYRQAPDGEWDIVKYTYEYLDIVRAWRLAFHMHEVGGTARIAHAHCEPAMDLPNGERSRHLRAVEYELREAHQEFMRLYAAEITPECGRYLPLEVDRT